MSRPHRNEPVPAPTSDALHLHVRAPARTDRVPGSTARPFPLPSPPLVPPTTAALPAGYHAPALDEYTTAIALHLTCSATPSPAAIGSRQHAHAGLPPSLHWLPGTPAQTRGPSPTATSAAHHHPALLVAASSYPAPTLPCPRRLLRRHQAQYRRPPLLPACNHPRRRRVGGTAVAPLR